MTSPNPIDAMPEGVSTNSSPPFPIPLARPSTSVPFDVVARTVLPIVSHPFR
jgi:hypothetical protein